MIHIAVFKVTGISPLLQNNPASMSPLEQGKTVVNKKIRTPEEEAAAKVYKNGNGTFYILSESFRSAIIGKGGAASGRKIGKRTAISSCSAGLFTIEPRLELLNPETEKPLKKYEIDTRRAVIGNAGVLRSRPMFPKWMVKVPFEIDDDWVTVQIALDLLQIAGKVSGVGDFRPQRKGSFGRFTAELETST